MAVTRPERRTVPVDGCSVPRILWRIALPLVMPGLVVSAILAFVFSWNYFLFALVLSNGDTKTLIAASFNFIGEGASNWGALMAAAHMDEIGLMVSGQEGAFLRFAPVGGVDLRTLVGQEVTVHGCRDLPGIEPQPRRQRAHRLAAPRHRHLIGRIRDDAAAVGRRPRGRGPARRIGRVQGAGAASQVPVERTPVHPADPVGAGREDGQRRSQAQRALKRGTVVHALPLVHGPG